MPLRRDTYSTQWKEAHVVQIETSDMCRKYKESAHVECVTNIISQHSLGTTHIWIRLVCDEVSRIQFSLV
jgi:hypothetical protein